MRNSKKIAVAGGTILALTAGGVAVAYWTTSGSGTGAGSTEAGQATNKITFTQTALSPMFPGDSEQNLIVNVKNTGSQNAYVSTVKAWVETDKLGCTGADYLLGGSAAPTSEATARALTWTAQDLAKSGGNADATSKIQFNNTGANQDACKSAAVTVHYLAS